MADDTPRDYGEPTISNGVPLVGQPQAITHLRLLYTENDLPLELAADLDAKILQASDAIFDYLKNRADPAWDELTAPPIVQAAVLAYLAHLWEHRGDEVTDKADAGAWEAIGRLLMRARDPAVA